MRQVCEAHFVDRLTEELAVSLPADIPSLTMKELRALVERQLAQAKAGALRSPDQLKRYIKAGLRAQLRPPVLRRA
ncbi:MAG: hypothetical protein K2Q10_13860 [Rhodospirillales bacterium]|nr:hypothetical protein [Rhodospirillales bacterium]